MTNEKEQRRKKIGAVVVEQGYISKEGLKKIIHQQVKEVLYSVFLWETGEFEYRDTPINVEGKLSTRLNTMAIVLDASRRIDEWSILRKQLTNENLVFKLAERRMDKDEIKLNKNEWRILSLIDGNRTIGEVVSESGYDEFAAYKILYSLMLSGLIEKSKEARGKKAGGMLYTDVISVYYDIFQGIQKDLKAELGQKAFSIFDECRNALIPKQEKLLQNFDLTQDVESNIRYFSDAMKAFKDPEKGRVFLVDCLSTLLQLVLQKEVDLLGIQMTNKTLEEINQILSYVREYQEESSETMKVVYEIETIIEKVAQGLDLKKGSQGKSGGVFSIFGKK